MSPMSTETGQIPPTAPRVPPARPAATSPTSSGTTGAGTCASASPTWTRPGSGYNLSPDEEKAIAGSAGKYRWCVTPYYASLMDPDDPRCPVRQQAVPAAGRINGVLRRGGRPGRRHVLPQDQPGRAQVPGPGDHADHRGVPGLLPALHPQVPHHRCRRHVLPRRTRASLRRGSAVHRRPPRNPRRAADRRRPAVLPGRQAGRDHRRAAGHPAAWRSSGSAAASRCCCRSASPTTCAHARPLPPGVAEHPLQPPEGDHPGGRRGRRPAAARTASRSGTRPCCCGAINDERAPPCAAS